jgi:hypothetical protein
MAHNITVLGHMWTFRRWFLARHYTIDDYIDLQVDFIIGMSQVPSSGRPGDRRTMQGDPDMEVLP